MGSRLASFRLVVVLAAACWVAAGPGGLVLRQSLAGRDAMAAHHGPHGHHMPSGGGPCFCTQMVGAFDQTVSATMPSVDATGRLVAGADVTVADPSAVPLPPSPTFTPETPPPIDA
jgi:hypothetical protein